MPIYVQQEEHHNIFSPPLPAFKAAAIENLGWGFNDKIFVEFDPAACSSSPPDELPSVAYHLLWDVEWPGPGAKEVRRKDGAVGSPPSWAPGVFSFRCSCQVVKFLAKLQTLLDASGSGVVDQICV